MTNAVGESLRGVFRWQPGFFHSEVCAQGLLGRERKRYDRFQLAGISDNDRPPRAPQSACRRLRSGLSGLIDQKPSERFTAAMREQPVKRSKGRGDDGNNEEQRRPGGLQRFGIDLRRYFPAEDIHRAVKILSDL